MKKSEVEVGGVYHARISGKFVHVRIDKIDSFDLRGRSRTTYYATNLMTNRKISFHSATKLRGKVIPKKLKEEASQIVSMKAVPMKDKSTYDDAINRHWTETPTPDVSSHMGYL